MAFALLCLIYIQFCLMFSIILLVVISLIQFIFYFIVDSLALALNSLECTYQVIRSAALYYNIMISNI